MPIFERETDLLKLGTETGPVWCFAAVFLKIYDFPGWAPTDIDQFDAVLLDGVQGDGDVLQGVGLALRSLVVFQFPLLKNLHQGNQSEENIIMSINIWGQEQLR